MRFCKIRVLGLLLAFALAFSNISTVAVYAAVEQNDNSDGKQELSELEITDLEEPVAGRPFDKTAKVTSAEGVEWEIPVIWVDESGNKVDVPQKGKKYFPTFAFFVPDGYKVEGADSSGKYSIKYPSFVTKLYGSEDIIFAADPATGMTFIFFPGNLYNWQQYIRGDYVPSEWNEPESNEPVDPSYDKQVVNEVYVPEPDAKDPLRTYCAQSAIDTLGSEFISWFVNLVKNTLQPQAAYFLKTGFSESLGSAASGTDLSSRIGLFVYYQKGEIDGEPVSPGALAFVQSYYKTDVQNNMNFAQIIAFDASTFAEKNASGKWIINDEKKDEVSNTVIHELLHAMMYDYNRYGMYNDNNTAASGQAFPVWFVEGIASAVENVYQFRDTIFDGLYTNPNDRVYTQNSVLTGYKKTYTGNDSDKNLDLSFCTSKSNTGSAYVGGYLATVYLGYLNAKTVQGAADPIRMNARGQVTYVDIEAIRSGVDRILLRLHGKGNNPGESMDTIIADISGYTASRGTQGYKDTDSFQAAFIKGSNNNGDAASLQFVTNYLTWLEDQNYTDSNGNEKRANGSILRQDQNFATQLNWDGEWIQGDYRIAKDAGMIVSSVDDRRANLTGGKSSVGDGTHSYVMTEERPELIARADNVASLSDEEEIPSEVTNSEDAVNADIADTPVTDELTQIPGTSEEALPAEDSQPEETNVISETPEIPAQEEAVDPVQIPGTPVDEESTGEPAGSDITAPQEDAGISEDIIVSDDFVNTDEPETSEGDGSESGESDPGDDSEGSDSGDSGESEE